MQRTLTNQVIGKIGQEVRLAGWVVTTRDHGKIKFFDLKDRSGIVQVVTASNIHLSQQDVVEVTGEVKKRPAGSENKQISSGEIEIAASVVKILAKATELPFDMGGPELNLELPTLLDWRALSLRHSQIAPIFKVQEAVIDEFRVSLQKKDFTEFQAPVIIPQTAEGGAEVFAVDYFGHKAFLSQSPQFYKQILVGVYERVFAVNKTLRAEPSVTTRHLTEVTTLDAEFGFIDSWEELMEMAEYLIKSIFSRVEKDCADILKLYNVTVPQIAKNIPRVKLREAQEIIFKRTGRDARNEPDLSPEDEREICRWSSDVHQSDLVFVSHYPLSKRPFYTFEDPDDPGYTLSFDLIGRGVEWLTGGQRVNNLAELEERAKGRGVDIAKSELYLQAFRFGMPPEGGFSFGSERITQGILNLANIREASLFPRDMERVDVRLKKV
ncbi:aspartate--tRNA(Asn) ligase [Candidatus Microgenomates bacterium]|nr:aspartate--tRNA(Asn) ligase [Candidatus Microgenomates bacterium]